MVFRRADVAAGALPEPVYPPHVCALAVARMAAMKADEIVPGPGSCNSCSKSFAAWFLPPRPIAWPGTLSQRYELKSFPTRHL